MTPEHMLELVAGAILKLDRAHAFPDATDQDELITAARDDLRWVRDFLMDVVHHDSEPQPSN